MDHQIPNQGSLSTQSTCQSYQESSEMSESSHSRKQSSTQSDNDDSVGEHDQGTVKPIASMGNMEVGFVHPKLDQNQPLPSFPFTYGDPCYIGALTAYGSHAMVNPQMAPGSSFQVPLPPNPSVEEPIYVNAKQYHAILRRRQIRAKLEAQNKIVKSRKPYLHESRHLHAMKRARGSGGRFLNTKQKQQPPTSSSSCPKVLGAELRPGSTGLAGGSGEGAYTLSLAPADVFPQLRLGVPNGSTDSGCLAAAQPRRQNIPAAEANCGGAAAASGGRRRRGGVLLTSGNSSLAYDM